MVGSKDSNDTWELHYRMIRHLHEKADANESAITSSIEALDQATSVFRAKAENLSTAVSDNVKRDLSTTHTNLERKLNGMVTALSEQLTTKFADTNVQAENAKNAYIAAASFAIWKVCFCAVVISAVILFLIGQIFVPDLQSLRSEERRLAYEVERLKANAEDFKRMEGANLIFSCPDGDKQKRCIRTDESAFKGKPYILGQTTYRAFVGVTP